MLYSGQWHNGDAGDFPFRRPREAEKDTRRKANSPPVLPAGCFYLEQFQFEVRSISNHTACRFAEKAQFFRSLWAGRRCAAASRFTFSKVKCSNNPQCAVRRQADLCQKGMNIRSVPGNLSVLQPAGKTAVCHFHPQRHQWQRLLIHIRYGDFRRIAGISGGEPDQVPVKELQGIIWHLCSVCRICGCSARPHSLTTKTTWG